MKWPWPRAMICVASGLELGLTRDFVPRPAWDWLRTPADVQGSSMESAAQHWAGMPPRHPVTCHCPQPIAASSSQAQAGGMLSQSSLLVKSPASVAPSHPPNSSLLVYRAATTDKSGNKGGLEQGSGEPVSWEWKGTKRRVCTGSRLWWVLSTLIPPPPPTVVMWALL